MTLVYDSDDYDIGSSVLFGDMYGSYYGDFWVLEGDRSELRNNDPNNWLDRYSPAGDEVFFPEGTGVISEDAVSFRMAWCEEALWGTEEYEGTFTYRFNNDGYRILGDLVCDCMDAYRLEDQRKLHSEQDSPAMTAMLDAYLHRDSGADYKTAVAQECRKQLKSIIKAGEAVKYVVAIKDKDFLWDVLYDKIYTHVKRMEVSRDAE